MFVRVAFFFFSFLLLVGCASYKQDIMFKPGENFIPESLKEGATQAERNYAIQKNDFLVLEIYSNNGEKIIDPNPELSHSEKGSTSSNQQTLYLVDINGVTKFPMIGEIKVEGLTLRQAELLLQKEYEKFFKTPFVSLRFNNKRVIVLGTPGGQVIPLTNENITLAEVLALAKGVNVSAKAHNIRVMRKEKVFIADFSSIEGFHKGNMIIENGDIVYVEPVRRPVPESLRDYGVFVALIASLTTLLTVLIR